MTFLVYCTDELHYVSDTTLKSYPSNEFYNEPNYETVKMFVVNNVNTTSQARDIISQETGLQVVKVEEI